MLDITKPVKFKEVLEEGDEDALMSVLEHNGDRCLVVTLNTGLTIAPTNVFPTADLINVE